MHYTPLCFTCTMIRHASLQWLCFERRSQSRSLSEVTQKTLPTRPVLCIQRASGARRRYETGIERTLPSSYSKRKGNGKATDLGTEPGQSSLRPGRVSWYRAVTTGGGANHINASLKRRQWHRSVTTTDIEESLGELGPEVATRMLGSPAPHSHFPHVVRWFSRFFL